MAIAINHILDINSGKEHLISIAFYDATLYIFDVGNIKLTDLFGELLYGVGFKAKVCVVPCPTTSEFMAKRDEAIFAKNPYATTTSISQEVGYFNNIDLNWIDAKHRTTMIAGIIVAHCINNDTSVNVYEKETL